MTNKELIKQLERLFDILDLMNNNIISNFYRSKLIDDINNICDSLKEATK